MSALAAKSAAACPSGAVCLYRGSTAGSGIQRTFWTYGAHNLSNVYGNRLVVNNQHPDKGKHAWADLCWEYGGRDCRVWIPMGGSGVYNFDPIDSILLGLH
ncbi:hypothetical protein D5H75_15540 [Bailinhaonella thermotolerans]|uniref:Peptidase inhibitor family I36 n=2 Tax=Bailinhaonella thermotolerans TaxID=1070861 RepID=A0A3A4BDF0_9ACTN|nr:hypothetical protein D5H75_15540 [Bailinhaonella thermotolerans]